MGRLIDAEECPCRICGATCPYVNPIEDCRKFNKWIMTPAYDVDKVVEELHHCGAFEVDWEEKMAIDVVKRGGM